MAVRTSNPLEAKEIAQHGVYVLQQIRACETINDLNRVYAGWSAYADKMRVCPQIRAHMAGAYSEVSTDIKAGHKHSEAGQ